MVVRKQPGKICCASSHSILSSDHHVLFSLDPSPQSSPKSERILLSFLSLSFTKHKGSKPVPKVIVRDPPSSSKSDPERSDSGLESDGNSEGSVVGETNSHSPTFPNARLDPKTKIQLKRAITSTSPEKMHEILHEIVDTEDALASALLPHFSAVQLSGAIAPRWIVCGVCGNEFDASTPRRKKECRWHSGNLFFL